MNKIIITYTMVKKGESKEAEVTLPVSGYIAQMLDFGKDVDHMVRSTIELMSKLQGYVSGAIEHITIVMERKK